MQVVSVERALSAIKSGDKVFVHTAAATPASLVRGLANRAAELRDVVVYHLHTEGDAPYADPKLADSFTVNSFFIGANVRKFVQDGYGSYIPVFLSEVPLLFRRNIISLNVALISVSPPDHHGFCSLGVSVDTTLAALDVADLVIAQVNRYMPRTHGEGLINIRKIDYLVEGHVPLPEAPVRSLSEVEKQIGRHVASLIEDRATLQMGIGAIPNAVLASLGSHKDLGIHSEMFADGIIPLVEKGVITGKYKYRQKGKIVGTFLMGSRKLYDFVDDNPLVSLMDCEYVNNTDVIRRHSRMTAVNSAVEIDLTGQVCADSIGTRLYSGVGGQMDFIRGASRAERGKAIIALPSITRKGISRIAATLKEGAGVVTTRAHVHYVVTEYGIANLYGKNIKERIRELIRIAHPDHRENLEKEARERLYRPSH